MFPTSLILYSIAVLSLSLRLCAASAFTQSSWFSQGIIVEFEDGISTKSQDLYRTISSISSDLILDVQIHHRLDLDYALFRGCSFNISGHAPATTPQQIRSLIQNLPDVKNAWPITTRRRPPTPPLTSRNAPVWNAESTTTGLARRSLTARSNTTDRPWPLHVQTGVHRLHAAGIRGAGIRIGILDTPVDYLHPALGGGRGPGFKFAYTQDFTDTNNDKTEVWGDCEHGTHVAGILGADETLFGFVGVAPEAEIEYAMVCSCDDPGIHDDVIAAAVAEMAERGVDVLSMSFGATVGWGEDLLAVIVQRVVENGIVAVTANGNEGFLGAFSSDSPANARNTLAVGDAWLAGTNYLAWNGTYEVDEVEARITFTPLTPTQFSRPLILWTPYLDLDSCFMDDSPEPCQRVPDPDNMLVLVPYLPRDLSTQISKLSRAGAQYVLFYSYESDDDDYTGFLSEDNFLFRSAGLVEYQLGHHLLSLLGQGKEVLVNLASDDQVLRRARVPPRARMAQESSWGPTYEAGIRPVVAGPGTDILSTMPLSHGGFGILSGTSMATPYIAGVVALMKQVNSSLDPQTINSILASTAQPMLFPNSTTKKCNVLASAFQQGGGMVDAYEAVYTQTLLNVSSLAFNDTLNQASRLSFTITNIGTSHQSYKLSHIPAASFRAFSENSLYPSMSGRLTASMSFLSAEITIYPSTVTICSGDTATITVSIACVPPLSPSTVPLYSGYIAINSTTTDTFLTVPYGGIAAPLSSVPVLDTSSVTTYLASISIDSGIAEPYVTEDGRIPTFNLTYAPNATTPMIPCVDCPAVIFTPVFGILHLSIEIVDAASLEAVVRVVRFEETWPMEGKVRQWCFWSGNNSNVLPPGKYRWRVRALRVAGSVERGEWDEIFTEVWEVVYTEGSVLPGSK